MKYGQTYGNRNPKPGARKRVGEVVVDGFDAHFQITGEGGREFRVGFYYLGLPEGRYEIVKVDE